MKALPWTTQFWGFADRLVMEEGAGRWHVSSGLWLKHGVQFPQSVKRAMSRVLFWIFMSKIFGCSNRDIRWTVNTQVWC